MIAISERLNGNGHLTTDERFFEKVSKYKKYLGALIIENNEVRKK